MLSAAKHLLFRTENRQSGSFAESTLSEKQIPRFARNDGGEGLRMTALEEIFISLLERVQTGLRV